MKIVSVEYCRHTGLGNKLFPWARAKIFVRTHPEYTMVQPTWFSPHGGAITRGGIDYSHALRKVWLLGNFKQADGELSRWKYWLNYRHVHQSKVIWLREAENALGVEHIVFVPFGVDGSGHDFSEFRDESRFLLNSLENSTIESQIKHVRRVTKHEFIGINIRCGNDFVSRASGQVGFVKTDMGWFCSALEKIRKEYGDLPAIVVSDGGPKQLAEILSARNVMLLDSTTAIADLLVLSHAKVLLGSGNSSFSAWASFLGEMDTFTSVHTPFIHGKGLDYGRNGDKRLGMF